MVSNEHPFHVALRQLFEWMVEQDRPIPRQELMREFSKIWHAPESLQTVLSGMLGKSRDKTNDLYGSMFDGYELTRPAHAMYYMTRRPQPNIQSTQPDRAMLDVDYLLIIREKVTGRAFIVEDEFERRWVAVFSLLGEE